MKKALVLSLLFATPFVPVLLPGDVNAGDPSETSQTRKQYREVRPDDSRGWLIVPKRSYWPLCFESLDRLEEVYRDIGKVDGQVLADKLEKCGAWLQLADDAAMTDGTAGISEAADYCTSAAESLRGETDPWSEQALKDLVVLGELSMAKSHLLRAAAIDEGKKFAKSPSQSKSADKVSKELRDIETEIRNERMLRDREQYRYDAVETQRHLEVAIAYLKAAQQLGGLEVDSTLLSDLGDIEAVKTPSEVVDYVAMVLRPRINDLRGVVANLHSDSRKQLAKVAE